MAGATPARRCALQALYQLEAAGDADPSTIRDTLAESEAGPRAQEEGFALALAAWARRADADAAIAPLTPDWPIHRQPVVDRSILRLAWHEMTSGQTPPKVAINEAVELAREFSTDKSPAFVNGVLDRILKLLRGEAEIAIAPPADAEPAAPLAEGGA